MQITNSFKKMENEVGSYKLSEENPIFNASIICLYAALTENALLSYLSM